MKSPARLIALPLAGVLAVVAGAATAAFAGPASVDAAPAPATAIRIWTDRDHRAAVEQLVGQWAPAKRLTVEVVERHLARIPDDLATVPTESAPDVIVAANDWTGRLAGGGLVLPLNPPRSTRRQFPAGVLSAFSYGTAVKRLYGSLLATSA